MADFDFSGFLTKEDIFKLEFEKYIPEFIERANNDSLHSDPDFVSRTQELVKLGEEAGIDLEAYIKKFAKDNGSR